MAGHEREAESGRSACRFSKVSRPSVADVVAPAGSISRGDVVVDLSDEIHSAGGGREVVGVGV